MMPSRKPDLAILVGSALSKAGMKKSSLEDEEKGKESEMSEMSGSDEHLQEIADDMMEAIHAKDSEALKELLKEAFEVLEMEPHREGEHLEE